LKELSRKKRKPEKKESIKDLFPMIKKQYFRIRKGTIKDRKGGE